MKKSIFVLLVAVFIIPSIAFASWWNPLSWFKKKSNPVPQTVQVNTAVTPNNDSQAKIEELQKEINDLKKKQMDSASVKNTVPKKDTNIVIPASATPTPHPTPTPTPTPTPVAVTQFQEPERAFKDNRLDTSSYNELGVADYIKNHKASLNKPVKIVNGVIIAFNQGSNNYIEVKDRNDFSSSPSSIEFRVNSDNNYTIITNELTIGDRIIIYGFGADNVKFNVNGSGGSYESYEPTIEVDAVYKCTGTECRFPYNMGVQEVFSQKKPK